MRVVAWPVTQVAGGLRGGGSSSGSTSLGGDEALIPAIWLPQPRRSGGCPPTGSNGGAQQEGRDRWRRAS